MRPGGCGRSLGQGGEGVSGQEEESQREPGGGRGPQAGGLRGEACRGHSSSWGPSMPFPESLPDGLTSAFPVRLRHKSWGF